MNILIPDSWLREHLKTKATPKQVAEYLSLCSQSVEKIQKSGNDWVYDIEITTNRPDCLSVYGIARELATILPRFGIRAHLTEIPETKTNFPEVKKSLPLKVEIKNQSLCPRFTAIIFDQVIIKASPQIVQERLKKTGVRALNNVVDISNYLMIELGQPMHTFDYDKIKEAKMTLRESKKNEKIITLDNQTRILPEGAIIIEDGKGRIIDLCGTMGGKNSEVDQNTKRVLLFVQTYDPVRIRKDSQALNFRTEASARFEKGVEPEGVILATKKAMAMMKKNSLAQVASNLIDLYPHPPKPKKVNLSQEKLNQVMGIKFKLLEAKKILDSLGFTTHSVRGNQLTATVPHWRQGDITLQEDLIEEVARIYGYHQLPGLLPAGQIPLEPKNLSFSWEEQTKDLLVGWGLTEIASYSMISSQWLKMIGYRPENYLKIANPLNLDLAYLRPTLIPSLLQAIATNQANHEQIKIFEMAHIYLPRGKEKLPEERIALAISLTGHHYSQAKGILEILFEELGIKNILFVPYSSGKISQSKLWQPEKTALIKQKNQRLGFLGYLSPQMIRGFNLEVDVLMADLDFEVLTKLASIERKYQPLSKFPAIYQDLTFTMIPKTLVGDLIQFIKSINQVIQSVELIDSFQNNQTFRICFQSFEKTLTDQEVEKIRKIIIQKVKKKFGAKLKQS